MSSIVFVLCLCITVSNVVDSFPGTMGLAKRVTTGMSSSLRAGVDVSNLPIDAFDYEKIQALAIGSQSSGIDDIQNALVLFSAAVYLTYEKRPLGSIKSDLVEVRKSTIPGAQLGLFAKEIIPEGVVIGTFPGYVKNTEEALKSKKDSKAIALAKRYMWALSDDTVLDPTNEDGILDVQLSFLFGLIKADTKIARINEPPEGKDCNVYTRVKGAVVEVITERVIFPSEDEIYMDYGNSYDRSEYAPKTDLELLREQQRKDAEKLREEEVNYF